MQIPPNRIEELGIVGAGGGGFPTAVKLRAAASVFIVNAAECEPLLHKDKELLHHRAQPMLRGLRVAMEAVGAASAVIGIKEKYKDVIAALEPQLPSDVRIQSLMDCYPAGDEFVLVYDVIGKVIPPGGLPKDVGAAVANVETLVNIGLDQPVTHKYLTVAGAVRTPVTLRVPVGMKIREVIEAAGGATEPQFEVLVGGVMMAKLAPSLDEPVTKTTGGLIVLPASLSCWLVQADLEANRTHRKVGVRPVPVLHRFVYAVFAWAPNSAAPGDVGGQLHGQ